MKVIAKIDILYQSHQYKPGEELPVNDLEMIKTWIKAGSAYQVEEYQEEKEEVKAAKKRGTKQ